MRSPVVQLKEFIESCMEFRWGHPPRGWPRQFDIVGVDACVEFGNGTGYLKIRVKDGPGSTSRCVLSPRQAEEHGLRALHIWTQRHRSFAVQASLEDTQVIELPDPECHCDMRFMQHDPDCEWWLTVGKDRQLVRRRGW